MKVLSNLSLSQLIIISLTNTVKAQKILWNELNAKAIKLYKEGRYPEAAKVAGEALKVSKKTFGTNHPNYATSLDGEGYFIKPRASTQRLSHFISDH
jgi:hypothetical protein